MKGWLKGGIIFAISAIFYLVIFFVFGIITGNRLAPSSCEVMACFPGSCPPPFWCSFIFGNTGEPNLPTILMWFLYGGIIGEIYGKVKLKSELNKTALIIILLVLIASIDFVFYLHHDEKFISLAEKIQVDKQHAYSNITYDDCVKNLSKNTGKYPPASEEPIGANRTDGKGRVWTKSEEINQWDSNGNPIPGAFAWKSADSPGTLYTNEVVDKFPGGVNYPLNYSLCRKYVITKNKEIEDGLTGILNNVISEESQKGIYISISDVVALNLENGGTEGEINLNCDGVSNQAEENEIIRNLADKLFSEYPNLFSKESDRNSYVDVQCKYGTGWRISEGEYNNLPKGIYGVGI